MKSNDPVCSLCGRRHALCLSVGRLRLCAQCEAVLVRQSASHPSYDWFSAAVCRALFG